MTSLLEIILVLLALSNLFLLGSTRIATYIRIVAFQGIILGALPFIDPQGGAEHTRTWVLAVGNAGLKGVLFPWILFRVLRTVKIKREVEPFVGYGASLVLGTLALVLAFWLASALPVTARTHSSLVIPVSFFTIFSGLFIIVSRKKALTQVLGFLVLENGIFALGNVLVGEIPVLVELGVLLDAFVADFVMGIAVYRIRQEFNHMDASRLNTLKG